MRFQESWYSYKGFLVILDDVFFYDHTLKKSTENRVQAFIKNTSGSLKYCNHSVAEVRPSCRSWKLSDDKVKHLADEQTVLSIDRGYMYTTTKRSKYACKLTWYADIEF